MHYTSVKNYSYTLLTLLIITANVYEVHSANDQQKRTIREAKKAFKRLRTIKFAFIAENPDYNIIKEDLKTQNVFLWGDISTEEAKSKQKRAKLNPKIFAKAYDLLKDLLYNKNTTTSSYIFWSKKNRTNKRGFLTYNEATKAGWDDFSLIKLDCFMSWYMATDTFQKEIKKINNLKNNTPTHVVKTVMKAYYPTYQEVVEATQKKTKSTRRNSSTFADFFSEHNRKKNTQGLSPENAPSQYSDRHQGENASSFIANNPKIAFIALSAATIVLLHSRKKQTSDTEKTQKRTKKPSKKTKWPLLPDQ